MSIVQAAFLTADKDDLKELRVCVSIKSGHTLLFDRCPLINAPKSVWLMDDFWGFLGGVSFKSLKGFFQRERVKMW